MLPKRSGTSALLIAACLVAQGCSGSSDRAQDPAAQYVSNGTLTIAVATRIEGADPYGSSSAIQDFASLAYDSLVNQLPDGSFVSGLASQWTVDAKSARFSLRSDVTCSDGTPLTASQVAAAITHVSNPNNQYPNYGTTVPTVPLTATGDDTSRTVTIALAAPYGFLLNTIGTLPIVCASGLKDRRTLKTRSAGTGPFKVTEVKPGQSLTFTVREDYRWGPSGASTSAPGTPAKVVVRFVEDETTAANLLLAGKVNLTKISGDDQRRLNAQDLDKIDRSIGTALNFNQLDGHVTADQRVRRALVQALSFDQLVQVSTGGTGRAATGLVNIEPKPCPGDTVTGNRPEHDVAAAEALLDEAGWRRGPDGIRRNGGDPLTIDLHFVPAFYRFDKPTAEFVAERWKALGVQVELSSDSPTGYTEVAYETSDWDVYVLGYDFYLPSQWIPFVSGTVPPQGTNWSGIDNADYNAIVAKAAPQVPPQACSFWNEAEQALLRSVNIAPIAFGSHAYYLKDAEATFVGFQFIPTTMRLLG
jgi:peptide/nickel transport system substrate-binding protein